MLMVVGAKFCTQRMRYAYGVYCIQETEIWVDDAYGIYTVEYGYGIWNTSYLGRSVCAAPLVSRLSGPVVVRDKREE